MMIHQQRHHDFFLWRGLAARHACHCTRPDVFSDVLIKIEIILLAYLVGRM